MRNSSWIKSFASTIIGIWARIMNRILFMKKCGSWGMVYNRWIRQKSFIIIYTLFVMGGWMDPRIALGLY